MRYGSQLQSSLWFRLQVACVAPVGGLLPDYIRYKQTEPNHQIQLRNQSPYSPIIAPAY